MRALSKRTVNLIVFGMTLLLCMVVAFAVCMKKCGYHEDEYYSYYSSNRTVGFYVEDGMKMDRDTILNEFSVVKGEGFNFALVKEVQSWDVHPPVYYFLLHLICSITPSMFSMWQGLALNLICLLISLLLMKWLGDILLPNHNVVVSLCVCAWGLSAATLTGVVFIRMYMLLTVWVLAITILHAKRKNSMWFWPILGILVFVGFMTHYYFFIWLFFLAGFTNLYEIVKTRKILFTIKYAITMLITFALCYIFYPAFPAQMFKGQRGAQATGNFFDISNTVERIMFFAEKMNRIGFGGILWIILLAAIVLAVIVCVVNKKSNSEEEMQDISMPCILVAASLCYFLTVSKTALILGDSSIRYQMPMLPVLYLAIVCLITFAMDLFVQRKFFSSKFIGYIPVGLCVLLIIVNCISLYRGNISFLYPEKKEHMEILAEHSDAPITYLYDAGQTWCIWDATDELLRRDNIYFVDSASDNMSLNEVLNNEYSEMILYVDKAVDTSENMNRFAQENLEISTTETIFEDEYCNVYLCSLGGL